MMQNQHNVAAPLSILPFLSVSCLLQCLLDANVLKTAIEVLYKMQLYPESHKQTIN